MIKSKILTRIITLIMALIVCCGSICGCSKAEQGSNAESTQIKETQFSLVENGVSRYSIITAINPTANESIAVDDLQKYFKRELAI